MTRLAQLKQLIIEYPKLYKSNNQINSGLLSTATFLKSKLVADINALITEDIKMSDKISLIVLGYDSIPICMCGKQVNINKGLPTVYCSRKCANSDPYKLKKAAKTNLKKYGTIFPTQSDIVKAATMETNKEKYGGHHMQTNDSIDKIKETKLERYGDESYNNRVKAKETNLERYGRESYNNRVKAKETNLERYGRESYAQLHYSSEVLAMLQSREAMETYCSGKSLRIIATELGIDYTTVADYIIKHDLSDIIVHKKSTMEIELASHLSSCGISFIANTRKVISPLELDFYLPEHNIAFELNGNYWHSEIGGKKHKAYHHNKWLQCREQGIDLYSYFDDEFVGNLDIIKNKIKYLVHGNQKIIGARKTNICDISYKKEADFLKKYHIQGPSKARNKTIGAYYNNELIAVFSWLKRKQYLEITRFACDSKASYPGLFSKMMNHMIRTLNYSGEIVSFSNNGHSNGGVYNASGFTIDKILGGAYWYTYDYIVRENRQGYMKGDIIKKFNDPRFREDNKSEWTEWQAMELLGYDRIWDSGKIKWTRIV